MLNAYCMAPMSLAYKDTGVLLIGLQGRRMGNASYGDPRGGRYVGETRGWKRHGQGTHVYSGGGEAFVGTHAANKRGTGTYIVGVNARHALLRIAGSSVLAEESYSGAWQDDVLRAGGGVHTVHRHLQSVAVSGSGSGTRHVVTLTEVHSDTTALPGSRWTNATGRVVARVSNNTPVLGIPGRTKLLLHGPAVLRNMVTGGEFRGHVRDSLPHGAGRMRFPLTRHFGDDAACEYRGAWEGGVRHGEGCWVWPDGSSWVGTWQRGSPVGPGVYRDGTSTAHERRCCGQLMRGSGGSGGGGGSNGGGSSSRG